jgi:hypothetical protein
VAISEDEVVVLWQQRGVSPSGDRFDGPVLGLYQLRAGKLARARMFYFDTAMLVSFLASAESQAGHGSDGLRFTVGRFNKGAGCPKGIFLAGRSSCS